MNGTQPNLLSAQLELAIKLYQAAIKEDTSLAADRMELSIGLSRQQASPPLWALASFLGREDPDQSNENFLLRLTEAIWAYSVQNPADSARLYDNVVKDVIYQHWASGGSATF